MLDALAPLIRDEVGHFVVLRHVSRPTESIPWPYEQHRASWLGAEAGEGLMSEGLGASGLRPRPLAGLPELAETN